jgi:hypothetical protein
MIGLPDGVSERTALPIVSNVPTFTVIVLPVSGSDDDESAHPCKIGAANPTIVIPAATDNDCFRNSRRSLFIIVIKVNNKDDLN